MSLYYSTAAVVTVAALGILYWFWNLSRRSISYLPGPPSESWLVGNLPSFQRTEIAGEADYMWTEQYGSAFRVKGCFGEDILYVSDPKALQYILNTSGYNFSKSRETSIRQRIFTGRSIVAVDGAEHARRRRIMNPSFSYSALKGFLPMFHDIASRTVAAWTASILKEKNDTCVMNVSVLMARTTLDAIGEAAFGHKFHSIEGMEQEYRNAFKDLLVSTGYMLSNVEIMRRRVLGYLPLWLSDVLVPVFQSRLRHYGTFFNATGKIAKDLLDNQTSIQTTGKEGGKDVMSILIKANKAEDPKCRLNDYEIISDMVTVLLAGHETTAGSLSWTLHELSKRPQVQNKLREEVKVTKAAVASRGDSELTISDLDSMEYTIAVMKETLRCYPVVFHLFRFPLRDDVIPLETPTQTISGESVNAIPIRKGQVVQLGLCSYNRSKRLWGQDADEWNPDRFLKEGSNERRTNLGVFANLATFSSGLRSCIGWRFALLEMQSVLVELVDNFEFKPVPDITVKPVSCTLLAAMVEGQEHKGSQLPITVSIIPKENQTFNPISE